MINSIKIYLSGKFSSCVVADIAFTDGVVETIDWADEKTRKKILNQVDERTIFIDNRKKRSLDVRGIMC